MAKLEPLAWDSEFFGFGIGRVHGEPTDTVADVAAAEDEARQLGIECLYATLDPAHADLGAALQRSGFRVVEVAMDLLHPTSIIGVELSGEAVVRDGTPDDLPALEEEIALMAPWSRFAVDRRFGPDAARRMHRAWVERAAGPDERYNLVVAEDEDGLAGFSTNSRLPDDLPRVDLIASSRSGTGTAYALLHHQYLQFPDGPSYGGPVAARNVTSMRFCEHAGYRTNVVRYLLHRWLDEAAPS